MTNQFLSTRRNFLQKKVCLAGQKLIFYVSLYIEAVTFENAGLSA